MATTTVAPVAPVATPIPLSSVQQLIDIITTSFTNVPLTSTFIVEIDSTPPPYPSPSIDYGRRRRHFAQGLQNGAESGTIILQAGDYSAVAIWEPPNFQGKVFLQTSSGGPIRAEWKARVKAAQDKYLHSRAFWHLAFLARNETVSNVKGAISAVVRPILDKAKQEGLPVWLEAVDERGVSIYEHWGFKVVDHVVLGKGTFSSTGWPEEDGAGVSGYCMIREP